MSAVWPTRTNVTSSNRSQNMWTSCGRRASSRSDRHYLQDHGGVIATIALALPRHPRDRPLLVLLSDGRATAGPDGPDPLVAAKEAAAEVRRRKVPAVLVDAEDGPLGLAAELAEAMGASYLTLPQLSAASVRHLAPLRLTPSRPSPCRSWSTGPTQGLASAWTAPRRTTVTRFKRSHRLRWCQ